MGKEKTSGTQVINQTTTPTPTKEETALNQMELSRLQQINPYMIPMQQQAFSLGSQLLQGQGLPGYLQGLPQGATPIMQPYQPDIPLSAGTLGEDFTNEVVQKSLRDIYPQFQAMGLPVESGVAQSIAGRTAGDIRRSVGESNIERQLAIEEYNRAQRASVAEANVNTQMGTQQFNMGQLLNLLNLAVGGQAQIQQPVLSTSATLGQRLAGLRSTNMQGTATSNQTKSYDFFSSPFTGQLLQAGGTAVGGWLSKGR